MPCYPPVFTKIVFVLQLDGTIRRSSANMAHSILSQKKGKITELLEEKILAPPQWHYSNDLVFDITHMEPSAEYYR